MDEAPEPNTGASPYLKLPWQLVAGGLLAVLLLALGAGLYANRYLRPQLGPAATLTPAALAAPPPPQATSIRTAAPPTATPVPAAAANPPTATPIALKSATPIATSARPTPLPKAAGTPSTPTQASGTQSPQATVEPELAADVGRAYEHYWAVWADAFLNLDTSGLSTAMDGEHLAAVQRRIDQLRSENRAVETHVTHSYVVVSATSDRAEVADQYTSTSVYVDPVSKLPLASTGPAPDDLRVLYTLRKFPDSWKVVDSVRAD